MKHRIFFISLLSAVALQGMAQSRVWLTSTTGTEARVAVDNMQVATTGDRTVVTLDFVLDSLRVPSNRYRAFTPVIRAKDGQQEQRLKTLIVTGRTQDIVFQRDGIDPLYADNCDKLRRHNGTAQTYAYTDAAPRQPWHADAEVLVECDLCGCGDKMTSELASLGNLLPPTPPDPYDLVALTDVVPAVVAKERNLHGSAYITFVVNKWEMKPDYMNNRTELRKITDTLDVMVADPNVSVKQIKIHGYASPESPFEHNRMLATNRAKSLTDWVKKQYNLPTSAFADAEATPENWDGLRAAVVALGEDILPHKQQILALIDDNTLQPDPKELKIKQQYPAEYRYLLQNVYPGLRRSDYDISFNFSDFTLEQAKEIYKTKPYQLSLRELWDVANTFEPYSTEYNQVLQTAVNIYPDAPEALVNLANVAIRQKDLLKAETLLQRAGNTPEAQNTRAVVALLKGDYATATNLLRSLPQGNAAAQQNLEAIATMLQFAGNK